MKKIVMTVIWVLAALFILSVAKDMILKISVEKGVELVTGAHLTIGSFKVGIINTLVDINNLRLFNPPAFKDRLMADMPKIYVKYDLPAAFKGKLHLPEVRLDLREFVAVRNEKGELNLNSLKVVQAQKEGRKPAGGAKAPEIQIDQLELKIGKVVYKDYSLGVPVVKEFDINLNERYSNITDPYSLVSLIVVKAMANTTIPSLVNFDLQGLKGTVSSTLGTTQKVATEAVGKARETLKATTKIATETAAKGTQETVKKTAEALTNVFKSPFGSK